MDKYRICKNNYGYYKVQTKRAAIKIFGIIIRKERFVNSAFIPNSHRLTIFDTEEEAQEAINELITYDEKSNKDWVRVVKVKENDNDSNS